MVKVVKDIENKIPIKVVSLIDYSGFSAELQINGVDKTIPSLSVPSPNIVLSAAEVSAISPSALGRLIVYNSKGEVHGVYKIFFSVVNTSLEVQQFKSIRIVIVSSFQGSSAESSDLARRVEKVEAEMRDKISVYYDESDDLIGFRDGY